MKYFTSAFEEFKTFAIKGNAFDLAVGLVLGASFNNIVDSLVKDIILPPVGLLLGRVNFSELYINLSDQDYPSLSSAQVAGAPTINYGLFLNGVITFIITAVVLFVIVKFINRLRLEAEQKRVKVD